MNSDSGGLFEAFLGQHDQRAWSEVVERLAPAIHDVDRDAVRIWFAFHPLDLARAVQAAEDPAELERRLWLQGSYRLEEQIDRSHRFLFGHRYWPEVKAAVVAIARSNPDSVDLDRLILDSAERVGASRGVDAGLVVAITAVAMMTLQQVGLDAFAAASESVDPGVAASGPSPKQLLLRRARNDGQGLFGFLKGDRKVWTVTFDEHDPSARFSLINSQELTTAAASDTRDYRSRDPRCHEGPIPVQCRSAFCGTCWVGVLGGADRLSAVTDLERRRIRDFGYTVANEPKPIIRLACQSQAFGAVSIAIPTWNGILGRELYGREVSTPAVGSSEPER